jgi:hypothetical protein
MEDTMAENEVEVALVDDLTTPEVEEVEEEIYEDELDDEMESMLDPSGAEAKRVARRPDLTSLEDAFEPGFDGEPLPRFTVGSRIILERFATSLPKRQWLSTNTYLVEEIDYETGMLRLWDPALQRFELSNWKTAIAKHGFSYKLAPNGTTVGVKRGRGRPRKNPFAPVAAKAEAKRGRGRPKGSKNRPKSIG